MGILVLVLFSFDFKMPSTYFVIIVAYSLSGVEIKSKIIFVFVSSVIHKLNIIWFCVNWTSNALIIYVDHSSILSASHLKETTKN